MDTNSRTFKLAAAVIGLLVVGGGVGYLVMSSKGPSVAPGPSAPAADDGGDAGDSDALEALGAFGSAYGSINAKVSYAFSVSSPEGGEQQGEMTQYWLPGDERWRMDSTFSGVTTISIQDGDTFYSCNSQSRQCFVVEQQETGSGAPGFAPTEVADEVEDVGTDAVVTRSSRTIAGRSASCFDVREIGGAAATYCFDDQVKVMLLMESAADGSTVRMEATSVSTGVPSADLEPPFPVVDLEAMMGGFTLPEGMELPDDFELPEGMMP